jgi:hypothetical protein
MGDTGFFAWLFKHSMVAPTLSLAPGVTVTALTLFGHPVSDFAVVLTCILTMTMIYKNIKEIRKV